MFQCIYLKICFDNVHIRFPLLFCLCFYCKDNYSDVLLKFPVRNQTSNQIVRVHVHPTAARLINHVWPYLTLDRQPLINQSIMITAFLCPTPSSTRQFYVAAENDLYLVLPPRMRKLQEETKFRIGCIPSWWYKFGARQCPYIAIPICLSMPSRWTALEDSSGKDVSVYISVKSFEHYHANRCSTEPYPGLWLATEDCYFHTYYTPWLNCLVQF